MDVSKDYYATLGVLPSAEDYIVQAAYKALCKRFHPDVYKGADAHERMAAINEAYEVLGDSSKRAEYDRRRGETTSDDSDFFNDDFDQSKQDVDPSDSDWEFAVSYYPELITLFKRLRKISSRLAFSFRAYLLQEKKYSTARTVADSMEMNYLNLYFGRNQYTHAFARELIEAGRKDILKELNKTVKILGSSSGLRIVESLSQKFRFPTKSTNPKPNVIIGLIPSIIKFLRWKYKLYPASHRSKPSLNKDSGKSTDSRRGPVGILSFFSSKGQITRLQFLFSCVAFGLISFGSIGAELIILGSEVPAMSLSVLLPNLWFFFCMNCKRSRDSGYPIFVLVLVMLTVGLYPILLIILLFAPKDFYRNN